MLKMPKIYEWIKSLALPIGGVENQVLSINNLGEKVWIDKTLSFNLTLLSTDWIGTEAPYTQTLTATNILSTDIPFIDIDLSNVLYADISALLEQWQNIYRAVALDNQIIVYTKEKPTNDINIFIKVVR
jgi:hypothetical protein